MFSSVQNYQTLLSKPTNQDLILNCFKTNDEKTFYKSSVNSAYPLLQNLLNAPANYQNSKFEDPSRNCSQKSTEDSFYRKVSLEIQSLPQDRVCQFHDKKSCTEMNNLEYDEELNKYSDICSMIFLENFKAATFEKESNSIGMSEPTLAQDFHDNIIDLENDTTDIVISETQNISQHELPIESYMYIENKFDVQKPITKNSNSLRMSSQDMRNILNEKASFTTKSSGFYYQSGANYPTGPAMPNNKLPIISSNKIRHTKILCTNDSVCHQIDLPIRSKKIIIPSKLRDNFRTSHDKMVTFENFKFDQSWCRPTIIQNSTNQNRYSNIDVKFPNSYQESKDMLLFNNENISAANSKKRSYLLNDNQTQTKPELVNEKKNDTYKIKQVSMKKPAPPRNKKCHKLKLNQRNCSQRLPIQNNRMFSSHNKENFKRNLTNQYQNSPGQVNNFWSASFEPHI